MERKEVIMKQVSFSALQKMAKEFDEEQSEVPEGFEEIKSAMDFYLYVVDNYEAVEKEVRQSSKANT
jgi:antitoxin component HigA of HigAB toxin-antitoxin module